MINRHAERICWILIFLTFIAGVFFSAHLGTAFHFYDEKEYYTIANNLVHYGVFSLYGNDMPTAWRPPGYVIFLTPWIFLGTNIVFLRILNYFVFCIGLYLVKEILKNVSNLASLAGVVMMISYPILFFTAGMLYPQTLALTLTLLSIWFFFRKDNLGFWDVVILGIIQGTLILTVATCFYNLIFILLWMFTRPISTRILKIGVLLLAAFLTLSPWVIRNYLQFHEFVLVSSNGGINLLLGNSPKTKANSGVNTDISSFRKPNSFDNEFEADRYYRSQALEYIKKNPLKSLQNYLMKFVNYFNYENELATGEEASSSRWMLMLISYGFILTLTLIRLLSIHWNPMKNMDWFLLIFYLGAGAVLAIFFTRIRFRIPYDPLLIILNARFIGFLFKKLANIPKIL